MTPKLNQTLKAVVTLTVALAFIMPGASLITRPEQKIDIASSNQSDWSMMIENASANPGDTGVIINVMGTWDEYIGALSISGYFDKSKIDIVNVNFTGSEIEDALMLLSDVNSSTDPAYFNAGMIYGFGVFLPPGSGILCKLEINIAPDAGDCITVLDLVPSLIDVGFPQKDSVYSNVTGNTIYPDLTDGFLTIGTPNTPPDAPVNQGPADGAIDVSVDPTLSVSVSDPDGDNMDVHFYVDDVFKGTVSDAGSGDVVSLLDTGPYEYGTTYDWYAVADDGVDTTQSATWTFTTINTYNLTVNIDGSGSIDLDPAGGIYEDGTTVQLTAVPDSGWEFIGWSGDLSGDTNPETLLMDADKTVTATFEELPKIPDLDGSGDLSWSDIEPGAEVTGTITIENVGDPESLLDWEIESYPEWGTWTFSPESGTDLAPEDGEFTIDVTVVAPDEQETEFTGTVKLVNSEDSSDYIELDVSLATPVVKNLIQSFLIQILQRLLERFPMLDLVVSATAA